jgi:hypothetical protein
MALRFTDSETESIGHGLKCVIYGRSGAGKTELVRTAPDDWCIAAIEPGLLSLSKKNQLRRFGEYRNIPVFVILTLEDLIEFYDAASHPEFPYKGIYFDSWSEIGEKVLANALAQCKDPRQAYGELQEKLIHATKLFRDLPGKHVVFVCKETTNKDGCLPLQIPAMPGSKLGLAVPYLVDVVLHLDIGTIQEGTDKGKTYRFLQTQGDINYDAKDRSGALDAVEEPNLTNILNKIVK